MEWYQMRWAQKYWGKEAEEINNSESHPENRTVEQFNYPSLKALGNLCQTAL